MIRFPVLIFFQLCIFYHSAKGQQQKESEKFEPLITLRTNPLSLAEPDGGVMIGIHYRWSNKFSATFDPTIIFFNPYWGWVNNNQHPFGIKIRADIRYYFNKQTSYYDFSDSRGFFIAPELHFKSIATKKITTFGINCIGQQCNYYMNEFYDEIKNVIGAALKIGIEIPLDHQNRWAFESYIGLGLKVRSFKEKNIPLGGMFVTEPNREGILGIGGDGRFSHLPALVKISYRIR